MSICYSETERHSPMSDTEVLLGQLLSVLNRECHVPSLPPRHLQIRIGGQYSADFIDKGYRICEDLDKGLKAVEKTLDDFQVVLDFGCGCGRTIRPMRALMPSSKLYGTDIDEEAVIWLRTNYGQLAEFSTNSNMPPTVYDANTFDLVIAVSVFTHLPEDMQFAWLAELKRIVRPMGYVLATTHGEKHYRQLDERVQETVNEKGFFYGDLGFNYGKSISLPDFYQNAFHAHDYIRREWARYFEVVNIRTQGIDNNQDLVLMQKKEVSHA